MALRRRLALALALSVAWAGALIPAVSASADGGIGVRPDAPNGIDPVTGGFLVENAAPGATVTGAVDVTNSTSNATTASVYAADGLTSVTTGAAYAADAPPPHAAGSWITAAAPTVTVAGGSEQTVGFTIHVPANATPGDHIAAIVVQQAPTGSSSGSVDISQIVRGVVPIDVLVSGSAAPQVALGALSLGTMPGSTESAVFVGLSDAGALMCRPSLSVTVSSPSSGSSTQTRQLDLLLPGDTISYPLPWPSTLTPGTYEVTATATGCGSDATLHQTVTLASVSSGALTSTPVSATKPPALHAPAPLPTHAQPSSPSGADTQPRAPSSDGSTPAPTPTAAATPPALNQGSAVVATHHATHRHAGAGSQPSISGLAAGRGVIHATPAATDVNVRPSPPRTRSRTAAAIEAILGTAGRVLTVTAFPLSLLIVLLLFTVLQDAIDRRDPKLSLAPAYADPELSFGEDALGEPPPASA